MALYALSGEKKGNRCEVRRSCFLHVSRRKDLNTAEYLIYSLNVYLWMTYVIVYTMIENIVYLFVQFELLKKSHCTYISNAAAVVAYAVMLGPTSCPLVCVHHSWDLSRLICSAELRTSLADYPILRPKKLIKICRYIWWPIEVFPVRLIVASRSDHK